MGSGAPPTVLRDPLVVAAALVAALIALLIGPVAFPAYTGNADEPVYVLQAEALADGHLTLDAQQHGGPFRPWLTGEHEGRIYTQYQPGWPAAIAAASTVGSMALARALAAAGLVVAAAALAEQVFADRRVRRTAAAATAATPLFILHSFTWLSYSFSAAWLIGAAALFVRQARHPAPLTATAAGAMLAGGLLIRPFDAVVVGVVLVLAAVVVGGRKVGRLVTTTVPYAALGAAPAVLLTLSYNRYVTGDPFLFPLPASSPENRFGFGLREILPGEPAVDYSFDTATDALFDNVSAIPTWTAFGGLAVVAAVVTLLDRSVGRRVRLMLGAGIVAFPAAYLFWWATALSAPGARNGLGPHYYLPAVALLTVVAARGVVTLVERARVQPQVAATRLVAVGLVLMAYNAVDKIDDVRITRDAQARHAEMVLPDEPTVVLLPAEQRYILARNPVMANDAAPEDDAVVFAIDDGSRNTEARAGSTGTVHRFVNVWHPGDGLFSPTAEFVPVTFVQAPVVCMALAPDANGRLIWGWDLSYFIDITDIPIELTSVDSGLMPLFFIPGDESVEWGRVILRYGPVPDTLDVEVERPTLVQRGARYPAGTVWLNSTERTWMPVDVSEGACP